MDLTGLHSGVGIAARLDDLGVFPRIFQVLEAAPRSSIFRANKSSETAISLVNPFCSYFTHLGNLGSFLIYETVIIITTPISIGQQCFRRTFKNKNVVNVAGVNFVVIYRKVSI